MPTNSERRAPIQSVSVPTRTSWAATRPRSTTASGVSRTVATNNCVASPRIWRTSRTCAPRRPSGPGSRAIALTELEVPRATHPPVLAADEPPDRVPVERAIRARVPAQEAVERRPHLEDAAILRQETIGQRRSLPEASLAVALAAEDGEDRQKV